MAEMSGMYVCMYVQLTCRGDTISGLMGRNRSCVHILHSGRRDRLHRLLLPFHRCNIIIIIIISNHHLFRRFWHLGPHNRGSRRSLGGGQCTLQVSPPSPLPVCLPNLSWSWTDLSLSLKYWKQKITYFQRKCFTVCKYVWCLMLVQLHCLLGIGMLSWM